jgi:DNA-binding CsgD family transcriptional regulator
MTGAATLLERSQEVGAITELLGSAREGSGRCLLLQGGAGLGKSRLAMHAGETGRGASMTVLRARAADLERDFTFGVVLQLFEPLLVAAGADRDALMAGPAALCEPLFTAATDGTPHRPAESEFPLLHGLHWLTANAAERDPLLLVVDDAHWADPPSLRFLLYLLQRLDELPVAAVVTARPEGPEEQARLVRRIARHQHATVHPLGPLSAAAVATLVRAQLGADADDDLCAACAAASGGNPFYLGELLAALGANHSSAADIAALSPDSASAAVLARVAALPDPASAVASAAAVLGDGAPLERAAALAGVDFDQAAEAADALAGAAVLERGAHLSFVHPIVREAVYSAVPEASRARAHARAAELLHESGADAELVALHLGNAGGAAGEWAVSALRDAAALARERGAPAAAARYLREASAMLTREADRGALLTELAVAEGKSGHEAAAEHAIQAIDAISGRRERALAALEIGMAFVDGARPETAEIFGRGLEELGEDTDDVELAMTLRSGRAAVGFGHAATAPGDLEAILARAERGAATPAERLMLAHGALAHGLRGESLGEIRKLARASLQGPAPDVTSATAMAGYSLAATALLMAGNLDEAVDAVTPALASARDRGSVLAFGTLSHVRAHALFRRGRLEEAIADAQSALDTARYGWSFELPAVHAVLSLAMIERGELDAAEHALEVAGGEKRWKDTFTWADLLDARGRVWLARGDAARALDDLVECGERLKPLNASHSGVVPWRPGAAVAALQLGDLELAGRLANEDTELARAFGAPRELGMALRAAGMVAGGDRGVGLLRESVDVLRESEAVLELAHSLADLGGALLAEGHRLAAREPLTEALDLAHACRADAVEKNARERLVATGARPRRASSRGSDALTPRERRIAQMAVEGRGNREIAAALFITTKTVETHLGRVYRKLGVTGRGDLPAALGD